MINFLKKLFGFSKTSDLLSNEDLMAANICPNCWGRQEYQDQFQNYEKDQTKSNINRDKENKKAFVQQFVETNITGIRLKRDGDHQVCPTCNTRFKEVPAQAN